ncbi:MAG: hypothetical protein ABJE47_17445, partial [bacterium]
LPLARLTSEEVGEILRSGLQRAAVDDALVAFVMNHTEGNGFLIMQLLGAMIEEGVFTHTPTGWRWTIPSSLRLPKGMTDLVARRLNRLRPETLKVLGVAASVGRRFTLDFVAEVLRIPLDAVLDAVDDALATSVLEPPADEQDESYQFAHALLVDAVLRTVNVPRRRAVNERIGDLLHERTPSAFSVIASHYTKGGNRAKAYRSCRRAATEALGLYALDEARGLLDLALAAAADDSDRMEVHEEMARVAEMSGRWADVEEACDTLLESAGVLASPSRAILATLRRLQARVRLGLGVQDAEGECRQLLTRAEVSGGLGEIVQTRSLLVQLLARKGAMDDALAMAAETERIAQEACDEPLIADAMFRRAITLNAADPVAAANVLDALIDRVAVRGDRVMQARAHLALGVARSRSDDDAAGARAFRTALALAQDAQALDVAANASMNLGVIELRYGAFESAHAALGEALRLYTTLRNNANKLVAIYNLANVARERGNMEDAAQLYLDTVHLASDLGADDVLIGAHAGAGLTALRRGDSAAAATALGEARRVLGERNDWWFQGRELLESLAIRMLVAEGHAGAAMERFDVAVVRLEAAERYAVAWFVADCGGHLIEHAPSITPLIDRLSASATANQFAPVAARFTALRDMTDRQARLEGEARS